MNTREPEKTTDPVKMAAYQSLSGQRPAAPAGRRPAWRRWRRPAVQSRAVAAGAMESLFVRRRVRDGLLAVVVGASLAMHAVVLPLVLQSAEGEDALDDRESSYLQKVIQKERAKTAARSMSARLTMPPPPPDPENVVENALADSLTSDVSKITAGLLPVELRAELTEYVRTSLKDQLDAASRDIAQGKMTEEQIQELHRRFQEQAHAVTVSWRQDYLVKHQVERAAMNTTEWYQRSVGTTLMPNLRYELFYAPHEHPVWFRYMRGQNVFGLENQWGFLGLKRYENKVQALRALASGTYFDNQARYGGKKLEHGGVELPGWPGPDAGAAEAVVEVLRGIHDGGPAWDVSLGSYLEDFYPHRPKELQEWPPKLSALWAQAQADAEKYRAAMQSAGSSGGTAGASSDGSAEATRCRDACFKSIRELADASGKVLVDARDYQAVNQAVRSRVLRGPDREAMYEYLMDELVKGLEPMIRDFARGQFKAGIIVHKDGVDQAMKEFPATVVPLLREDLMRMLPKEHFDRAVFVMPYMNPYRSKVTGEDGTPDKDDIRRDEEALSKLLAKDPALKNYAEKRTEGIRARFRRAIDDVKEELLQRTLTGSLIVRNMGSFVEGVDYTDRVGEKLDARAMAMKGRGQDLARLTENGLPDTSATLVALMFGASKGHGANLEPVMTRMLPGYCGSANPFESAVRAEPASFPKAAAKWGFETQAEVKQTFDTPALEGIPFLPQFPRLDGDLADWGSIRPLILKDAGGQPIMVYAAWNYQGFFFGYKVNQPEERFYYPTQYQAHGAHDYYAIVTDKVGGLDWALRGDHFRVWFDTLDARRGNRGEPHAQEFVIFPRGTDSTPEVPGIERVIESQRDAQTKQWRGVKATCKNFPLQPATQIGPDGTGPFRATKVFAESDPARQGYCMEVFLPRTLFAVPIFSPGWYVGFDCAVAMGAQARGLRGQAWATADPDHPNRWGDLLLLGTDAKISIQEVVVPAGSDATPVYRPVSTIVPGQSYLLTVVDPDRNIDLKARDTVLVSAEVAGGHNDVEVFVLQETGENTSVFRGFLDTQPGLGRQVQAVLEVMPMQEVRFGYVDIADSKGRRNVVFEMKLPVVAPTMAIASGHDQGSARPGGSNGRAGQ